MFKANSFAFAGKAATLAVLLGGSSLAIAQDAIPITVQPTIPAPVQQAPTPPATPVIATPSITVQPPEVVQTVPDRTTAPVAQVQSETRSAAPSVRSARQSAPASAADSPTEAPASSNITETEAVGSQPAVESTESAAPIAPVAPAPIETASAETNAGGTEDWILPGGIAALLAALGIGALATRRRRSVGRNIDETPVVNRAAPDHMASQPIIPPVKEDPIFHRAEPVTATNHVAQAKPLTRLDIPVTDPLFSHKPVAMPITDPMFAPKTAVEPPITDPMFAKHNRYVGRNRPEVTTPVREPELIN